MMSLLTDGYLCYLSTSRLGAHQAFTECFHYSWSAAAVLTSDLDRWVLGFNSYIFIQGQLVMVLVVSVVFLVLWLCIKNLGKLGCHFSFPALFYPCSCRSCLMLHPVFVFLPFLGLPWFVSAAKAAYTPQKGYITFYVWPNGVGRV